MLYGFQSFDGPKIKISKVRPSYYCTVEVCLFEVGPVKVCLFEVGPAQVGSAQVGFTEVSSAQVGFTEVGSAEISELEICPTEVNFTEINSAQVGRSEVGVYEVGVAVNDVPCVGVTGNCPGKFASCNPANVGFTIKGFSIVGFCDNNTSKGGPTESCQAKVGFTEVGSNEECFTEVGFMKISSIKISFIEVSSGKVNKCFLASCSPSIPHLYTLFEEIELFLFCHATSFLLYCSHYREAGRALQEKPHFSSIVGSCLFTC